MSGISQLDLISAFGLAPSENRNKENAKADNLTLCHRSDTSMGYAHLSLALRHVTNPPKCFIKE
jgi:hypothetical protein